MITVTLHWGHIALGAGTEYVRCLIIVERLSTFMIKLVNAGFQL